MVIHLSDFRNMGGTGVQDQTPVLLADPGILISGKY